MAQTPDSSPEKVLSSKTITPEEAASFKGRIPTGIRDQVLAINEKKRQAKLEPRRQLMERRKKDNAIVQQRRLDAFLEEFLKNGGNATEAAMTVFNCSNRSSAASVGSAYLRKARAAGQLYLEQKGYSWGRLLSIAAKKAEESRLPDWFDRVWEIGGYGNFRTARGFQPVTNVNIVQTEKEIFKKYAMEGMEDAEEAEVVDDEFLEEEENED